ncbi:DUF4304 domain-containing protein [Curtobacterium sp. TXMA1]|uniref:DUF4304 domain-containing protein n=1 Tax=Curtobacterium sp. TXMA1 TaxID=2876939 RepID=UPI001CCC2124|nr:DUF4304 domain-containing protein [Curtobacterium sp. TXMA1]UBQ01302.1 DUF4304 domain-containing protein [Curtobacterium sp. TXMA1]
MITAEVVLRDRLRAAGFRKARNRRWFIDQQGLWVELELQRSRYGGRSFINIGLHLDDPDGSGRRDVYTRLDVWVDRDDMEDMLLDENPELERQLAALTEDVIIPFVRTLTVPFMRSPQGHELLGLAQISEEAAHTFHYA